MQSFCKAPQLHKAASGGFNELLRGFLEFDLVKASIDSYNAFGYTPLHYAAQHGHADTVNLLLENGASANLSRQNVASPLQIAAELGHTAVIRLLLKYDDCTTGDNVDKSLRLAAAEGYVQSAKALLDKTTATDPVDSEGNTALHLASRHGHAELVCVLLDSDKFSKDLPNEGGMTAMHLAAREGYTEAVAIILEHEGSAEITNADGDTPMHIAAAKGYINVVELLCAKNPSIRYERNSDNETPLILAAKRGHVAAVKKLLHVSGSGSKQNGTDEDRDTALHLAASMNHLEACQTLLSHMSDSGIEAIDLSNNENETPLYRACCFGHTDVAKLLLDNGADCNKHCTEGCTPLHIAAFLRNLNVVRLLLDKTADYNALADIEATPIMLAAQEGHADVTAMLFEAGAAVDMVDSKGSTALHYAAWDGHLDCVEFLVEKGHVDYSLPRKDGRTPLHLAAVDGHVDVAKYLLEKGAQLSGGEYGSALHAAIEGRNVRSVKLLLEHGADPAIEHKGEGAIFPAFRVGNLEVVTALLDKMDSTARAAKDRNGRSLLACAIGVKNKDIGDYLISMNLVPIQDKDLYGRTPLMEAVLSDNADMVKTLLRMGADPNASDTERKTPL
ncbi:hypothetical protein TRIATDRAFT_186587, partial [Trichoderma atroviride IMI 206040]